MHISVYIYIYMYRLNIIMTHVIAEFWAHIQFVSPLSRHTLHLTATHCISRIDLRSLSHTSPQCTTLQHTATHCNTLQHTATHCNTHQALHSIKIIITHVIAEFVYTCHRRVRVHMSSLSSFSDDDSYICYAALCFLIRESIHIYLLIGEFVTVWRWQGPWSGGGGDFPRNVRLTLRGSFRVRGLDRCV